MGKVLHGKNLKRYFKKLKLIKQEDKKIKEDKKVQAGFHSALNPEDKAFLEGSGILSGWLGLICLIDACSKGIFWLRVSLFLILNISNSFLYIKQKKQKIKTTNAQMTNVKFRCLCHSMKDVFINDVNQVIQYKDN